MVPGETDDLPVKFHDERIIVGPLHLDTPLREERLPRTGSTWRRRNRWREEYDYFLVYLK